MNKRFLLSIHKWLGLIAGIFILIMGLTGSILVFDDEIEQFIQRDVIHQPNSDQPVSLDNAYTSITRKHPNWDVRFTVIPDKAGRAIEAEIRRPDDRRYLYLHPVTGDIMRDLDSESTFSYWMLKLHYQLHSGFTGEIILLIAGLMFIGSLITGFWFYRKAIKRVLTFKIRPRFRNLQSTSSELHRSVGVWALIFNLITAVTGVVIMLIIVQTHLQSDGDSPSLPDPPAVEASLDKVMETARQSHPGFDPSYMRMPAQPDRQITLYGHMDSDLPIHYEFSNYVQFDPETGRESNAFFVRNQPVTTHLLSFTYPLHFGDWGGIIIKILYCLFGLAPAILSITGFIIWLQRERKKRGLQRQKNPSLGPFQSQEKSSRIDETLEETVV
ncbi:PepSY-associated TM helix domain-containing protein [Fodinibius sp.]|uniref:PepSY-associated TM helix domain-containing protein n=1 Tax=Fodinibius sp. TaxID=1872440 RepID=UPI003568C950